MEESTIKHVAVICKGADAKALEQADALLPWLRQRGVGCHKYVADHSRAGEHSCLKLAEEPSLVVVLGGDGTMLGAVRAMVSAGLGRVPILGVNLGGLGFLTALSPQELLPAMERVLAGEFIAPPRMMLEARVRRGGEDLAGFTALNDVVINKAALAGLVELETLVDGRGLTTFRADGLIFSTPTGSTAYNLSAGGPICHPALDCIVVTPICSFALSNRPLLLGPEMVITIALDERAQNTSLTCDGQVGIKLEPGDELTLKRAETTVSIVHSPFKDYFEILRTKLRWAEGASS